MLVVWWCWPSTGNLTKIGGTHWDKCARVVSQAFALLQHTVMRCYWWCLFYVPPRRPNLHSPPVTPCKCMEQQPTQLPPTECAETSSSSQTHKQNSKHSGMTFELLVCMWALVSCTCSGTKEGLVGTFSWLCWVTLFRKRVSQSDC